MEYFLGEITQPNGKIIYRLVKAESQPKAIEKLEFIFFGSRNVSILPTIA